MATSRRSRIFLFLPGVLGYPARMRLVLATLHSRFIHASLALPCLAAYLRRDKEGVPGLEVDLLEFTLHEPKGQILAAILQKGPDAVAFSVYLWNRRETLELADALAAARPGVRVVLGGPEVSFDGPELFDRHPGVTALVRGEGEIPFRGLFEAWRRGEEPAGVPRLAWRRGPELIEGPDAPPLADLDLLPSPFELGLVDLSRPMVYLETSRGCPYACAFCMSALDRQVRSFSPGRILSDLDLLMRQEVGTVKLVDRTFNYDPARARRIWSFILERNRASTFHFEIGAHLLEEEDLRLLAQVPKGMFQFEIGVQSTLPATLEAIGRRASLERLEANVRRLREAGNIHLHLDLIAGLPGEGYRDFLASIDRVAALAPDHLQVEPVKLLPGSPLRRQAAELQLRFDPHPPYTVLGTPALDFAALQRLAAIARLLDLTWNAGRLRGFLAGLGEASSSLASGLEQMADDFHRRALLRHPLSQRSLFQALWEFVQRHFTGETREGLRERLGRDFAHSERVVPDAAPPFFDTDLTAEEETGIRERVRAETAACRGQGVKVQHFAARFSRLPDLPGPTVVLFLYRIRSGGGMEVVEVLFSHQGVEQRLERG